MAGCPSARTPPCHHAAVSVQSPARITSAMKSSACAPCGLAGLVVVAGLLLQASASPIRYDQRQDGDWNVDARLQNFFVVLAPSNSAQLSSSGISLLDFASKAVPLRLRPGAAAAASADQDAVEGGRLPPKQRDDPDQEDEQHVQDVKGKTGRAAGGFFVPRSLVAANAVPPTFTKDDILKSPLAKLHPEMQVQVLRPPEEILIARSPVVALKYPAVPMLVAVPVPEVAPEATAPPALLPIQPMQPMPPHPLNEAAAPNPLNETPAAPEATPETKPEAVPEAAPEAPPAAAADAAAVNAAPVIVAVEAVEVADVADVAAPAEAQPAQAPAQQEQVQPSVETNQVEPEAAKTIQEELSPAVVEDPIPDDAQTPKVHLIGTGIEDCGPLRTRNGDGVCVEEAVDA